MPTNKELEIRVGELEAKLKPTKMQKFKAGLRYFLWVVFGSILLLMGIAWIGINWG